MASSKHVCLVEKIQQHRRADYEARHPALFAYVKEQMTRPEKQFLLIGDTDHNDPDVYGF